MKFFSKKDDPTGILRALAAEGIPQKTLAALVGAGDSALSAFLSGRTTVSLAKQASVFAALKFCKRLKRESKVPVDFRQIDVIKRLWAEQQAAEKEEEILRESGELLSEAGVK